MPIPKIKRSFMFFLLALTVVFISYRVAPLLCCYLIPALSPIHGFPQISGYYGPAGVCGNKIDPTEACDIHMAG
jgi:hypothetical protein